MSTDVTTEVTDATAEDNVEKKERRKHEYRVYMKDEEGMNCIIHGCKDTVDAKKKLSTRLAQGEEDSIQFVIVRVQEEGIARKLIKTEVTFS